jgi:hypothetical protein
MFVRHAMKLYKEFWRAEDRTQSVRLKNLRAEAAIKTVRECIRLNPLWKQKITFRELNISTWSTSYIIRDDLHTTAHHRSNGHLLTILENRPWRSGGGGSGVEIYLYFFFNRGAWWSNLVNRTPRPLYPQEWPNTHCTANRLGPRSGLDVCGKSRHPPHPIATQSPAHWVRSESHKVK